MPRNIIKLAGGNYLKLKTLVGEEALQDREVVLSKDTNELYTGKGDGSYHLLSPLQIGEKKDLAVTDPLKGRFFFDNTNNVLYIGNGTGWKRIGGSTGENLNLTIDNDSGLLLTDDGELKVKVDDESIEIDENGNLAVKNTDYGEF